MGEARGAALAAVAEAGLEIYEIAPRKVKQAIVGYGAAQKLAVAKMVQRMLHLAELPAPDAADALALALAHAQEARALQPSAPRKAHLAIMITFLHGKLVEALPTQVIVDVNGVGYEVLIPLSSFDKLPAPGQEVKLLTHLVVREDAHVLYGFMTRRRARPVPAAHQHRQRHRPEDRPEHAERHERDRFSRRGGQRRRESALADLRRGQEDRRAHRGGTEGQDRRGGRLGGGQRAARSFAPRTRRSTTPCWR